MRISIALLLLLSSAQTSASDFSQACSRCRPLGTEAQGTKVSYSIVDAFPARPIAFAVYEYPTPQIDSSAKVKGYSKMVDTVTLECRAQKGKLLFSDYYSAAGTLVAHHVWENVSFSAPSAGLALVVKAVCAQ